MPRSITGYVFPLPTEVYNSPILKTDADGYILGEEAPNHHVLVGGDTEVKSIVGTAGQILISNGALADPAFVDTSTVPFANIEGGNKNDIVYQFDTDNTDFTPAITLTPEEETLGVTYVLKQAANTADYPKFTKNLVLGTVTGLSLSAASVTGGVVSGSNLAGLTGAKFISGDITGTLQRGTVLDTTAGGTGNTTGSLAGGTANQIPYQFTNDLTYFTGPGQTGQVLIGTTGAPPSFSNSINGPLSINSTGTIKSTSLESLTTIKGVDIEATTAVIAPTVDGLTSVTAPAIVGLTSVTAPTGIFPTLMQSGAIATGAIGCGIITSAAIAAAAAVTSLISVSAPLIDGVNVSGTNFTASGSIKDTSQAQPGGWASMRIDSSGRFLGTDIIPGLAAEIQGGTAGAVVYQAAVDDTAFVSGAANQLLQSNGTSAPTFTSSPTLQTLQITNTSVSNALNLSSTSASNTLLKLTQTDGATSNRLILENSGSVTSGELSLETSGTVVLYSENDMLLDATEYSFTNLASAAYLSTNAGGKLTVNASFPPASLTVDIQGGTAGSVVYQAAVDDTAFVSGTTNQLLQSNGTSAPTFTSSPTLQTLQITNTTGSNALNLSSTSSSNTLLKLTQADGATSTRLVFENTTDLSSGELSLEPTGEILLASVNDIQFDATEYSYTNLANAAYLSTDAGGKLTVNASFPTATLAADIQGGAANQIVYQSGVDTTAFLTAGVTNEILVGNTGAPPSFTSTPTLSSVTLDGVLSAPILKTDGSGVIVSSQTLNLVNATGGVIPIQITQSVIDEGLKLIQTGISTQPAYISFEHTTLAKFGSVGLDSYGAFMYGETGIKFDCPVNTIWLKNYGSGIIQSTAGILSASSTLPATTITNAVATPALTINQNSLSEAIRVNCSVNTVPFVFNIPVGQLYNGLYVQASAAGGNLTYYGAGARVSIIGQALTTNNFQVVSDRAVLLQGANGTIINAPTTSLNTLIWHQNSAAKVSSISQEATTGVYAITSDSDIKITPGTSSKTTIVKQSNAENKLEFSQNAGAKISSISQVATTGQLSVKSDTSLKLDAPAYNLTGIVSAPFLKTDASSNIIAGTTATLFRRPYVTKITATGTHTFQSGVTYFELWASGGGGGGGGGDNSTVGGGGGGGGECIYTIQEPTAATLSITIGSGGTGGALNTNGVDGDDTIIEQPLSTAFLTAKGGKGGDNGFIGGGGRPGGTGGTSVATFISHRGGAGDKAVGNSINKGGSSYFSGGGETAFQGSGGNGASPPGTGGNGSSGVVLIKEYFT